MKHLHHIAAVACALAIAPALAQQAEIGRMLLGSGEPGQPGFENATALSNNIFHAPQYLPGSPTAATIWPRVIEVPCRTVGARLQCDGYNWTPRMGRAEYLYFTPALAPGTPVAAVPVVEPEQVNEEAQPLVLKAELALAIVAPLARGSPK